MSWLQPVMYAMVVGMFAMLIFKTIKDLTGAKKPKLVEIPRDTQERLEKAYKTAIKGKLNKDRMRHTLWASGDSMIQGYRVGDIIGIQPQNEMYKMHIKSRWWMFWRKAIPIYIDPILCSDLNCRDIVVECRGFEAVTEGVIFPIPNYNTKNLEKIYLARDNFLHSRVLKQSNYDMGGDSDILVKMSMRGDLSSAGSEIGRPEMIPELKEEEIRKLQKSEYRRKSKGGEE